MSSLCVCVCVCGAGGPVKTTWVTPSLIGYINTSVQHAVTVAEAEGF